MSLSLVAVSRGYSIVGKHSLLVVVASLVAEHRLLGVQASIVAEFWFPGFRVHIQYLWAQV